MNNKEEVSIEISDDELNQMIQEAAENSMLVCSSDCETDIN